MSKQPLTHPEPFSSFQDCHEYLSKIPHASIVDLDEYKICLATIYNFHRQALESLAETCKEVSKGVVFKCQ
jgi:hypothetical protein